MVNKAPTATALTSAPNPSFFGDGVTFTATVSVPPPGAGLPTGIVTFTDGAAVLGTGTLNAADQATFTTAGLQVGSHSITATYGGDGDFLPSTSTQQSQLVRCMTVITGRVNGGLPCQDRHASTTPPSMAASRCGPVRLCPSIVRPFTVG